MFSMVEVRQIRSKTDLDVLVSKIREVIAAGEVVTVSWKKTQFDVFYETFDENKNIANPTQYSTLEKLLNATPQYKDLHSKILITLVKYNIDQNNFTIAINYIQQLQIMDLQYPDRHHYLDILKTLKNMTTQLAGQNLQDIIKLLLAENLMSKKDLLEFYENLSPEERNVWYKEQILIYDKHNLKIAYEVFQHYKHDHRMAQKYYCIGSKTNQQHDMQYMTETFVTLVREFETRQQEIENLQQQIDSNKSSGTINLPDQILLCQQLLELKKQNNSPVLDTVKYYIYLSQLHKQENKIDVAIKCIEEALKIIKVEKLVNYHPKLLYEESVCYDNLGEYYKQENKLVESLQAFTDSLELKEESKEQNSKQLLFTKMQLAGTYSKLKNFDKSLEIFFKVLKTQQKLNCESHIIGSTQNNIASILLAQGQFQKAQQYADIALQNLAKKYQDTDEIMKKVRSLKERIDQKLASQKI